MLPVFAHLGPEGWLRDWQSAYADVDSADDFGLLLSFGRDCVGAIGVIDPEQRPIGLKALGSPLDQAAIRSERTISGVQAKILCVEENGTTLPAGDSGPAPLIAKFPKRDLPGMVRNEALTLELCAVLLGKGEVNAVRFGMVEGIPGVALIVERFDRRDGGNLRCEDFMQVLNRRPGRDHQGKYNASYEDLGAALEFSSAPVLDRRRAFLRLAAYVLVGNVDCHMKNWSLMETATGLRLTPAYDALNGYVYGAQGYTTRFGLLADGERAQWDSHDRTRLLDLAARIGLPRKAAEAALDSLKRKKEVVFARLDRPLGLP
ncbi:type II toxin-antitoxin system HipA family toxin [Azospirillum doebereinerae]